LASHTKAAALSSTSLTAGDTKVAAELEKSVVTVDQKTGDAHVTRKGKFKGFGKGFADWLNGESVQVGASFSVGQYPAGHPQEGEWAVQIMLSPVPDKRHADKLCDAIVPIIEGFLGSKAVVSQ